MSVFVGVWLTVLEEIPAGIFGVSRTELTALKERDKSGVWVLVAGHT